MGLALQDFRASWAPQEMSCIQREAAANLARQNHEMGPPSVADKLGVPGLLATPGNCRAADESV